jgi:adenosylcobalamin-dependent ribonucleoside-triphosphate reductase
MDGSIAPALLRSVREAASRHDSSPHVSAFGTVPLPARRLEPGMGLAVARRTVFRPEDAECFGRVADRVAAGSMSLLGRPLTGTEQDEQARLRNAIATGALITSGRHLQHGDPDQASRNMEVFTNCATAIASFAKFYLLLNGSGVGRAYDDELVAVDWARAPEILLYLSPAHPDYPRSPADLRHFAAELSLPAEAADAGSVRDWIGREMLADLAGAPAGAIIHPVADSREGWAKAIELLESLAFQGTSGTKVVFDLSAVRPRGAPIRGMQGRPASGPISLLRALLNIRHHVIEPARRRDADLPLWEQALRADHHLSVEVQVGGARRAARMATKTWRDPGIFRFIRCKSEGGMWTANHSVMVDREFWQLVAAASEKAADGAAPADPLARHALAVFEEVTRCAYINGEPGFINGDRLEDHRTGSAWEKPVYQDGRDFRSARYQVDHAAGLLAALSARAREARFPVTTNPCGEIALHVTGGYCVIADFAPLLACPGAPEDYVPGCIPEDEAALWDARVVESVRLGVRFLSRANTMDALYAEEVKRTNRMGIGPTGLHEWAWVRFGLAFDDLLDEARSAPFWDMLAQLSAVAKQEGDACAAELGRPAPFTVTTVKPAGTTSKLFGLTEGAHLPARRQYLRWVMFQGSKNETGAWATGSDRLLADYEARGYPIRTLNSFPNMSIVGFPTLPLMQRLGLGERLVTAPEASPAQHYRWLELLERHWIGAERGNQVSYTLKVFTDLHGLEAFRAIVLANQPRIRCCAVLPSRPDHELGYEYLPEEEVGKTRFSEIVAEIRDPALHEMIDLAHLQCAGGACPI